MSRMIEVVIDSVRVSLTSQQRIVVLKEVDRERYLTIWIGPYEAEAITIALQEIEVSRPQTHDLIKSVMHSLNGRLLRVEVVALKDDVYYGNLVIEQGDQIVHVDTRPSDALALAVRAHVPVMISQEVMDAASVIPEEEAPAQDAEAAPASDLQPGEKPAKDAEDRLSVFEDFLEKLDLGDEDNPAPAEDSDEPEQPK